MFNTVKPTNKIKKNKKETSQSERITARSILGLASDGEVCANGSRSTDGQSLRSVAQSSASPGVQSGSLRQPSRHVRSVPAAAEGQLVGTKRREAAAMAADVSETFDSTLAGL